MLWKVLDLSIGVAEIANSCECSAEGDLESEGAARCQTLAQAAPFLILLYQITNLEVAGFHFPVELSAAWQILEVLWQSVPR